MVFSLPLQLVFPGTGLGCLVDMVVYSQTNLGLFLVCLVRILVQRDRD
jgi:hypothetical protein